MVITDDRPQQLTDDNLLASARAGDAAAFTHLIEPHQARLFRQAAALASNVSTAEDLVSETLVEAWKSLPRYNGTCRLSTWLYAILLHRHKKTVRRARSRPIALAWLSFFEARRLRARHEQIPSSELSPAEVVTQDESFVQLRRCVDLLPEKQRQIIRLRFFEDASLADMATVLDCSLGTVKSRLHHALEKLRQMKMNLPDPKGDTQL